MLIKYTWCKGLISSVTVETGLSWAFQYVTQFEILLKGGLPGFSICKFHKQHGFWKRCRLLAGAFFESWNAQDRKRYGKWL